MNRATVFASLLLVTLAGCTEDAPHSHGTILTCNDGTVVDAANFTDHHAANFTLANECPAAPQPDITVALNASNAAPFTYEPVAVQWHITPLLPEGHSMLTELRVAAAPGDALEGPDSFGDVIDKREHQNTPASFEAEWVPEEAGTFYLRAYAENQGDHYWSPPVAVTVVPVEPTGVVHTITVSAGGPAATLDAQTLDMVIGDAVVWTNEDAVTRHFISSTGPQPFDSGAIAQGESSALIVLLAPGTYDYASSDPLSDVAALTGTLQVKLPSE